MSTPDDPRPMPRDLAVLEAHARLEAATGRPATERAVAVATGLAHASVADSRARLVVLGLLTSAPRRGGGHVYRTDPAALELARGLVPRLPHSTWTDHEIAAAAAALVAEGVYPSNRAVAELVGCIRATVHRRMPRLVALGLWPDWEAAGLSPRDARVRRLVTANARRRKRAAGETPRGARGVRMPTIYRDRRPA